MSELRELYQQVILDHNRSPHNFGKLENADRSQEGYNPLCGDHLQVHLKLDGDTIQDISFEGSGCAISKASASLMTDYVEGRSTAEAAAGVDEFQSMMTSGEAPEGFGDLEALAGVSKFPMRVKCASLSWKTLEQALGAATQRELAAAAPITTDERSTDDD